jgi:hypothetical protein
MRALRAVLTAAIAHACAAFAPAAGSLGLRAFTPDQANSRGLIGRMCGVGGKRKKVKMAVMSLSKIQELNKGAWEARLAALEKQAILDFQTAIREFYSEVCEPARASICCWLALVGAWSLCAYLGRRRTRHLC